MIMRALRKIALLGLAVLIGGLALTVDIRPAGAHGERTQEPFFRMRSMQWYDVKWSKTKINVNEEWEMTAKVYMMKDWPETIATPDLVFVSALMPGPVMARVESSLNDVPARQSFKNLELGKHYEYKIKLKGRTPGRWHVHPEIAVHTAGPLVGPGEWIEVVGDQADFVFPIETMTGEKIENLGTYGVLNVGMWHLIWLAIGAVWLLYWLLRPLLLPRFIALQGGREDLLIRRTDVVAGAMLFVVSLTLVFVSYYMGVSKYPNRVPLQVTVNEVTEHIEQPPQGIKAKVKRATYDVPGRALRVTIEATNTGSTPLQLGEFTSSSLRFVNMDLPQAVANVDANYPKDWVPAGGLAIDDNRPLQPGETRIMQVDAVDVAWELERLTSFITDVDARFGALLFFYEADGTRHITEIAGPILPVFKQETAAADTQEAIDVAANAQ